MRTADTSSRTLLFAIAACTAMGLATPPQVGATAGDFDYAIERVTVDGNLWGPHDGTPDAVEEAFQENWGVSPLGTPFLANWGSAILFEQRFGTVQSIDGALHVTSPGTMFDIPSLGILLNMSDAASVEPMLRDGAGDARVEVLFQPATLGLNHFVHATFNTSGGEFAGLEFSNFDEFVAARNFSPAVAGFCMSSHLVGSGFSVIGQTVPLDPSLVGGAIVLALDYDDTAKTITPSFSLDGGQTFSGGFDPLTMQTFDGLGAASATLMMGADPRDRSTPRPPCPSSIYGQTVTIARHHTGGGKVSFHGHGILDWTGAPIFDPVSEGAQLVLTDLSGPAVLVQLSGTTAVPPGAPGTGCDPRDGWTGRYRYRNYSNALPPACTPGSANGLSRMTIRRSKANAFKIDVTAAVTIPAVPAAIAGPMSALFVRGQSGNSDQSGACLALQSGDTPCVTSGSIVHCKE